MSSTDIWGIYGLHTVSKEPLTVVYLGPCQISKKKGFAKTVNALIIFAKHSILDVSQDPE